MLRGLAAMLVVYNHAIVLLALAPQYELAPSLLASSVELGRLGAIGVDLFFVISGFVMALSAPRFSGPAGAGTFLAQRFVRIAPLFYLACLLMLAEALRAGLPIERASIFNSITFIPLFDDETYSFPLHYLGWTLAFEFVFYLAVAALIAVGRGRYAMLAVVTAVPLIGFALQPALAIGKVLTNPILWEFSLGVIACLLYTKGWLLRLRLPLTAAAGLSLVALGCAVWLWPEQLVSVGVDTVDGDRSIGRVLLWGVPAFLCFAATAGRAVSDGRLGRLLKLLGDASYSIYLSHLFVVMIIREIMNRVAVHPDVVVLVTLAASAVAGILIFRLVEAPLLKAGRHALNVMLPVHAGAKA